MRRTALWLAFVGGAILFFHSSLLPAADSPAATLAEWYEVLNSLTDDTDSSLVEKMLSFYIPELQEEFMPEVDPLLGQQDETRAFKAVTAAAALHREWAAFLAKNNFTKQSFEMGQESFEEDRATVIVRSDSNTSRSFRLENPGGRGWLISQLEPPDKFAATIRILAIVVALAIALGIIAKKLIFT